MKNIKKRLFYSVILFFVISMFSHFAEATNEQEQYNAVEKTVLLDSCHFLATEEMNAINQIRKKHGLQEFITPDIDDCMEEFIHQRLDSYRKHILNKGVREPYRHDNFAADKDVIVLCEGTMVLRSLAENTVSIPEYSSFRPINLWMNSSSHRANILNKNFTHSIILEYVDVTIKEKLFVQLFFEQKKRPE